MQLSRRKKWFRKSLIRMEVRRRMKKRREREKKGRGGEEEDREVEETIN